MRAWRAAWHRSASGAIRCCFDPAYPALAGDPRASLGTPRIEHPHSPRGRPARHGASPTPRSPTGPLRVLCGSAREKTLARPAPLTQRKFARVEDRHKGARGWRSSCNGLRGMAKEHHHGPALARRMGLFALIVYGVGDMLGAGIYALVGKWAGIMGNAVWLGFVVSWIAAVLTGLSYASLGSRYPKAAGAAYISQRAWAFPF